MKEVGFMERLQWSKGHAPSEEHVMRIIANRIPACTRVEAAPEHLDRKGTDWLAHRDYGLPPLRLDLKARRDDCLDYGKDDLALETWSVIDITEPEPESPVVRGRKIGWTRDPSKNTDFILFYWRSTGRFLLAPFPSLCFVFERMWHDWAVTYEIAKQETKDPRYGHYYSQCVYVPRREVMLALLRWCDPTRAGVSV